MALFQGSTLLRELELTDTQSHAELFLGVLDSLLTSQNLQLGQVDRYLTTSGPGSFTGLRIAWSSLKAFALAHQKSLWVVPSDEARARAWLMKNPGQKISLLTPLGKKSWVLSEFDRNGSRIADAKITEDSNAGELLPLRASDLILCPNPVELKTAIEIAGGGPTYLGSRW